MSFQLLKEKATTRFVADKKKQPHEAGFDVFCKINDGLAIFAKSSVEADAFKAHQKVLNLLLKAVPLGVMFFALSFFVWVFFIFPLSSGYFWGYTITMIVLFILALIRTQQLLNKCKDLEKIFQDKVYLCAIG